MAELHVYAGAGHGFGLRDTNKSPSGAWPARFYDWLADRWVITQMAWDQRDGFTHQCVAVSATADPLGAWHRYQFPYAAPNDFGKIGLWPDAYLFSTSVVGTTYQPYVCAFDRVRMLEGADATAQCFPVSADEAQPMPADLRVHSASTAVPCSQGTCWPLAG